MKKIYLLAVALVAFAAASFAQCVYDQQTGTIKIWKPDPRFSVSASKQVYFSPGNLQYNSDTQKWQFAAHQYDYIGNTTGNTSVTADGKNNNTGIADLFGWVGASSTWDTELKMHGLTSSSTTNAVDGYGNSKTENLKSDWGTLIGPGWRTLTKDEWFYLFHERTGNKASTVNGSANIRFAKATVNSVSGVILFPDGETFASSEFTTVGSLNTVAAAYTTTTCTLDKWQALEEKGCVFLPAAGYRAGTSVHDYGTYGRYWASSPYTTDAERAYALYFAPNNLSTTTDLGRGSGRSVRLVKDVE